MTVDKRSILLTSLLPLPVLDAMAAVQKVEDGLVKHKEDVIRLVGEMAENDSPELRTQWWALMAGVADTYVAISAAMKQASELLIPVVTANLLCEGLGLPADMHKQFVMDSLRVVQGTLDPQ